MYIIQNQEYLNLFSRNPTPQREELLQNIIWPKTNYPTTFENLVYLNISDPLKLESNYDTPNLEFWRNLYFRSGNQPYDTYWELN